MISGYKYTEYDITALTQHNVIMLIESQNYLIFITESVPNIGGNLFSFLFTLIWSELNYIAICLCNKDPDFIFLLN